MKFCGLLRIRTWTFLPVKFSRRIVQFEVKKAGPKIAIMMIVTNIPFRLFT